MKNLIITLILFSPLAFSELRNTPRSFWGSVSNKMGMEESLDIEIKNNNYILKGSASEKRKMINDLSRLTGINATGQVNLNSPIIINDIIPSTIKNNKWDRHLLNGPNCHNNTLLTLGLMDRRMYVAPEEFSEHLKYYCEEINTPEKGAIGVQFSNGGLALHSYTIISMDMTYEKANVDGAQPPYFKNFSDSRKKNDTFYSCQDKNLKRSCSPHVLDLDKRIDHLHKETRDMIHHLSDATKISEKKQRAYQLEAEVFIDGTCGEYQELLVRRLHSIIGAYTEMEMTGAIYGKTTYDRSAKF